MRDVFTAWQMVKDKINMMKKKQSSGPDEIFPLVSKECKDVLNELLADILKMSVDSGYMPS